jgi:hypothetical protein
VTATYTDKGAPPVGPLTVTRELLLYNPRVEAEIFKSFHGMNIAGNNDGKNQKNLGSILKGAWAEYSDYNLTGIKKVTCRASSGGPGGRIEFRNGSKTGEILSYVEIKNTGDWGSYRNFKGIIRNPGETVRLFLTFNGKDHMMNLNWFEFSK